MTKKRTSRKRRAPTPAHTAMVIVWRLKVGTRVGGAGVTYSKDPGTPVYSLSSMDICRKQFQVIAQCIIMYNYYDIIIVYALPHYW